MWFLGFKSLVEGVLMLSNNMSVIEIWRMVFRIVLFCGVFVIVFVIYLIVFIEGKFFLVLDLKLCSYVFNFMEGCCILFVFFGFVKKFDFKFRLLMWVCYVVYLVDKVYIVKY